MRVTAERLRELLNYDLETGVFTWRTSRPGRWGIVAGTIAGCSSDKGYRKITVDRKRYFEHRLAWLYVTGLWPTHEIDHVDGEKSNNRFANLREAIRNTNMQNMRLRRDSASLAKCVYRRNNGRWSAYIKLPNKRIHLGTFDTKEQAADTYVRAARHHFGVFARVS